MILSFEVHMELMMAHPSKNSNFLAPPASGLLLLPHLGKVAVIFTSEKAMRDFWYPLNHSSSFLN